MTHIQFLIIKHLFKSKELHGETEKQIFDGIIDENIIECDYKEFEKEFQQLITSNYIGISAETSLSNTKYYDFKRGAIKKLLDEKIIKYEEVFFHMKKLYKSIESVKEISTINLGKSQKAQEKIMKCEESINNVDKKLLSATKSIKIELLTLMGLFISIFSLISINTTFMKIVEEVGSFWNKISFIFMINFTVLLSIYGLMTIIRNITNEKNESKSIKIILVILFILIIVSLLMA
ncbi:TPA: hypothetical protein ACX96U_001271 [Clostridium sporogenes]